MVSLSAAAQVGGPRQRHKLSLGLKKLFRNRTTYIFEFQPLLDSLAAQVCVQTTMREANDRGYECLLVSDATESYFPAFKEATLQMIVAQGGIVGWTADSTAVEAALA